MTEENYETGNLRTALTEAANQVRPRDDAWDIVTARPPAHAPRRRFVVPAIAAALTVAVAVALTVGVVLLRGGGRSGVRTPATEGKETSPEQLLSLEADVQVFMRTDGSAELATVRDFLRRSPDVREFSYVDKATTYEEFRRTFRDRPDLVGSVDSTALPASFRVRVRDCAARPGLVEALRGLPGVDEPILGVGLPHADAFRLRDRHDVGPTDAPRGRCGDQLPGPGTSVP